MSQLKNRRVILKQRATGLPTVENFALSEDPAPEPGPGQVLVHNTYVSVDTGMKGWISTARNYASVETGATMNAFGVGEVVASRHPDVTEGDIVTGLTGWQTYGVADPRQPLFRKVDPSTAPISTALGVLGVSGLTAYFGLLDVGQPKPGETVLVSTAAGAVGSAVGQIAALRGYRPVGIAGGPAKTSLCRDVFGYEAALDYKAGADLAKELREVCPNGVDVYFDNVGGATLDLVLKQMNAGGRVVICGTAATESWDPPPLGPRVERDVLVSRLRIQGFLLFDYAERFAEALGELGGWVKEGQLRYREDILEGLEQAPAALAGLYEGRNMGRQLVRVRPEPRTPVTG